MILHDLNPHWELGYRYPVAKHRRLYGELLKKLGLRQILQITGLRRTGKTTLLFQLINHLLDQGHDPLCLWYFSFDRGSSSLEELMHSFSTQTNRDFKTHKIFVFLDEIQKLRDFQAELKVYYDLYPNLKFIISGSSSLFIRKRVQESLAGRIFQFVLHPLAFSEYLVFTDQEYLLEQPRTFAQRLFDQSEVYLRHQFIESLSLPDDTTKREFYTSIMRKIVFEDIPAVFSANYPEIIWQIVQIVGQMPGMLVDYQSLANDLGVSKATISNYVFFLEESYLLRKLYNFSRSLITSEKKLKRSYLASASFSWALAPFQDTGRLVENAYASLHDCRFFWRDPFGHEIDFVEVEGGEVIPVEVKYKDRLLQKDLRNLRAFCRKFGVKRARVYMKTPESTRLDSLGADVQIEGVPASSM